jgi:two-component system, chemotaxis family, sensor kinase CheA
MPVVDEFVEEFLKEGLDHLSAFEVDVVAYRSAEAATDDIQRMFRAVHTVKGVCGFLGFGRLETITMAGEAVIGKIRDGQRALDLTVLDALAELAETMRVIMEHIGNTGEEPEGDDAALLGRLYSLQATAA